MKRNSVLLTLVSLIVGAALTLGLTRASGATFAKSETCPNYTLSSSSCTVKHYGYPLTFLHSNVTNQGSNVIGTAWIEFKPATVDWLIWSVVSAAGVALLVYLLERAGFTTGFADKKRRR